MDHRKKTTKGSGVLRGLNSLDKTRLSNWDWVDGVAVSFYGLDTTVYESCVREMLELECRSLFPFVGSDCIDRFDGGHLVVRGPAGTCFGSGIVQREKSNSCAAFEGLWVWQRLALNAKRHLFAVNFNFRQQWVAYEKVDGIE